MSNTWGNRVKITIFGESHGPSVGVVLDGLPVGFSINWDKIVQVMGRRAPGKSLFTTQRQEKDSVEILSGLFHNTTQGSPICAMIRNTDTRSRDYTPHLPRPSHADFVADRKYHGFQDYRGGGMFSGRLTAGIVFAGGIAMQILESRGVTMGSHITRIGKCCEERFSLGQMTEDNFHQLTASSLPLLCREKEVEFLQEIQDAKNEQDSVGGTVECGVIGLPYGLGEPFFEGLESGIASLLFSIPGVKGVEFGTGFQLSEMRGSVANDEFVVTPKGYATKTNHSGGLQGGISNGMPLTVQVAFKPTPSIGIPQKTVNLLTGKEETLTIQGRHDPCIALRGVCVVEAAVALALLDSWEVGHS